jgi:hypothetical protein
MGGRLRIGVTVSARGGRVRFGGAEVEPFEIEFAGERLKTVDSVKVGAKVEEPLVEVEEPVPDRAGRGGGGGGAVRGTGSVSE